MQELRLSIRSAGNTMIPALHALRAKGYTLSIWYTRDDDGGLVPQYDAEKDRRAFSATSPEELLGLVAMWEVRGDDWRLKAGESELYDRLVEEAPVYDSEGNLVDGQ
jgi:hypothetical protein